MTMLAMAVLLLGCEWAGAASVASGTVSSSEVPLPQLPLREAGLGHGPSSTLATIAASNSAGAAVSAHAGGARDAQCVHAASGSRLEPLSGGGNEKTSRDSPAKAAIDTAIDQALRIRPTPRKREMGPTLVNTRRLRSCMPSGSQLAHEAICSDEATDVARSTAQVSRRGEVIVAKEKQQYDEERKMKERDHAVTERAAAELAKSEEVGWKRARAAKAAEAARVAEERQLAEQRARQEEEDRARARAAKAAEAARVAEEQRVREEKARQEEEDRARARAAKAAEAARVAEEQRLAEKTGFFADTVSFARRAKSSLVLQWPALSCSKAACAASNLRASTQGRVVTHLQTVDAVMGAYMRCSRPLFACTCATAST